jgi:hypothetical protein
MGGNTFKENDDKLIVKTVGTLAIFGTLWTYSEFLELLGQDKT